MGEIRVKPGALASAGGSLESAGAAIRAVAAVVEAASGFAGATGDGAAGGSYARMCAVWSRELAALQALVTSLGATTQWAGSAYEATDQAAMPATGGGDH